MLVLQNSEFKHLQENSVGMKAPWMRDTAGILFRFHSLTVEGNLKVSHTKRESMARGMQCYRTIIIDLVEGAQYNIQGEGHFDGAIYSIPRR